MSVELKPLCSITTEELERLVNANGCSAHLSNPALQASPPAVVIMDSILGLSRAQDADSVVVLSNGEAAGLCVVRDSAWDTSILGIQVGRIESFIAATDSSATELCGWLEQQALHRHWQMASARVASEDTRAVGSLEGLGFRYRETTLTPWLCLARRVASTQAAEVRRARLEDRDEVMNIARHCFKVDRFHRDPGFRTAASDEVYAEWAANWFERETDESMDGMVVFEQAAEILGFVAYDFLQTPGLVNLPVCRIALVGVRPECAKRGIARALCDSVLDSAAAAAGSPYAITTVTSANTGAMALYQRLGFIMGSPEVTLHRWY